MKKIQTLFLIAILIPGISAADNAAESSRFIEERYMKVAERFDKKECVKRCNGANGKCYQDRNPLNFCKRTYNHCMRMCDQGVYTHRKGFY